MKAIKRIAVAALALPGSRTVAASEPDGVLLSPDPAWPAGLLSPGDVLLELPQAPTAIHRHCENVAREFDEISKLAQDIEYPKELDDWFSGYIENVKKSEKKS